VFVLRAHREDKRLVLVITGKGRDSDEGDIMPVRRGVLRHQVPHWLSVPPLSGIVLQVTPPRICAMAAAGPITSIYAGTASSGRARVRPIRIPTLAGQEQHHQHRELHPQADAEVDQHAAIPGPSAVPITITAIATDLMLPRCRVP
jgi:hypothetical protein